ncbi:MAG: nucleotidyltransferase family protein [Oscillospiraceae bacterium]|jgi:predicted nucleotidyltransferase|nr:nucleotidyltransferase family protein [Oscillospiraceae bacterium]
MKTYGIICEYNPFHNGHIYQIEETRKQGATHIVAIMSGNYVQRGDVAMIDKFARAKTAVANGVDLVVEMPVVYSLSSANFFARAGVMMLGALGCVDGISFGSECGDIELLKNAAMASINASKPEKIKPLVEQGMSFPQAIQQAIALEYGPIIASVFDSPNNTLAVEYLKAIKLLNLEFETFTVKRKGAEHDSADPSEGIASASLIRSMIEDGKDISPYVPKETAEIAREYEEKELLAYFDNLERELLYVLRSMIPPAIAECPDVDPALANFIFRAGIDAKSLDQFLEITGTKRYTAAKIRRVLLNLYIGTKASDLMIMPPYGRILAFNDKGSEILKASKEKSEENKLAIPFDTSLKDIIELKRPPINRFADISNRATNLYGLASRTIRPCAEDFTAKIEIQ